VRIIQTHRFFSLFFSSIGNFAFSFTSHFHALCLNENIVSSFGTGVEVVTQQCLPTRWSYLYIQGLHW
jgi:hypothetical protein